MVIYVTEKNKAGDREFLWRVGMQGYVLKRHAHRKVIKEGHKGEEVSSFGYKKSVPGKGNRKCTGPEGKNIQYLRSCRRLDSLNPLTSGHGRQGQEGKCLP